MSSTNSKHLRSVNVRSLDGRVIAVEYDQDIKCSEFVEIVKRKFNVTDNFIITCAGSAINPNGYIRDLSLNKYSILTMAYSVPGGKE